MQIDWVTLGAQVLNFAILVLLLRHFLYRRITGAIDRRQEEIASRMAEAEREREEAEKEGERHRREREELQEERDRILEEARREAKQERERLLEEARNEVERRRERWQTGLRRQKDSFIDDIREGAASAIYSAVHGALRDLADQDLQSRVVDTFLKRLSQASEDDEVRDAIAGADEPVVRTALDLDEQQRKEIADLLRDEYGVEVELSFDRSPELVLGIQLEVGDHAIGWTAQDYLRSLEEEVANLIRHDRGERSAGEERGEEAQESRNRTAPEDGGGAEAADATETPSVVELFEEEEDEGAKEEGAERDQEAGKAGS